MGGAERTARKRRQEQMRQQAAKPAAKPAARGVDKRTVGIIVAVVLLAAAVTGGIVWYPGRQEQDRGANDRGRRAGRARLARTT